jgi:microcystin-dependent protein
VDFKMPRNGSGTYTLPQSPFVAGTTISSAAVNSDLSDIATALTGSLPRDGQVGMSGALKAPDGSVAVPSLSFNNETDTGFYRAGAGQLAVSVLGVQVGIFSATGFSGSAVSVGTVVDFAGPTAPAKWLMCFGQNVSRTTYADLFAVIGTLYGTGDGSTTFGLPDLRGRLTYGGDAMGGVASGRLSTTYYGTDPATLGNAGGTQSKTLIGANLPAYTPAGSVGISDPGHTHGVNQIFYWTINSGAGVGGGGAFGVLGTTAISIQTAGTGISAGFTGSAQGGTSTAFSAVAPGLITIKMIYAGV